MPYKGVQTTKFTNFLFDLFETAATPKAEIESSSIPWIINETLKYFQLSEMRGKEIMANLNI
jgi:hypothetical protein